MASILRAWAIGGFLALGEAYAGAEGFPDKPVTILVPFSAGGAGDQLARSLARQLSDNWKQPVIIDNRPGANGIIATQAVTRAKADGYTLLLHNTTLIQTLSLLNKPGYDPFTQLEPVAHIGFQPVAIAVSTISPFKTIDQLVAGIRKGDVKAYGTFGSGTTGHIYGELFRGLYDADMVHIPYKGESPMLTDLVPNRIPFGWISGSLARTVQHDGTLRVLAITGPSRNEALGGVPTFAESGIKGFEVVGWWALFAPTGTPDPVVKRLAADVEQVKKREDFKATLTQQVIAPSPLDPKTFASVMRHDSQWWASVINQYGIKAQ